MIRIEYFISIWILLALSEPSVQQTTPATGSGNLIDLSALCAKSQPGQGPGLSLVVQPAQTIQVLPASGTLQNPVQLLSNWSYAINAQAASSTPVSISVSLSCVFDGCPPAAANTVSWFMDSTKLTTNVVSTPCSQVPGSTSPAGQACASVPPWQHAVSISTATQATSTLGAVNASFVPLVSTYSFLFTPDSNMAPVAKFPIGNYRCEATDTSGAFKVSSRPIQLVPYASYQGVSFTMIYPSEPITLDSYIILPLMYPGTAAGPFTVTWFCQKAGTSYGMPLDVQSKNNLLIDGDGSLHMTYIDSTVCFGKYNDQLYARYTTTLNPYSLTTYPLLASYTKSTDASPGPGHDANLYFLSGKTAPAITTSGSTSSLNPVISYIPTTQYTSTYTVRAGTDARLICSWVKYPPNSNYNPMKVQWYLDQECKQRWRQELGDTPIQVIQKVTLNDARTYYCRATDFQNPTTPPTAIASISLVVQSMPYFQVPPSDMYYMSDSLSQGSSVSINVKIVGVPKPTITWSRFQPNIPAVQINPQVTDDVDPSAKFSLLSNQSTLVLQKPVKYTDSAVYQIVATNQFGQTQASFSLYVYAATRISSITGLQPDGTCQYDPSPSEAPSFSVVFQSEAQFGNPVITWTFSPATSSGTTIISNVQPPLPKGYTLSSSGDKLTIDYKVLGDLFSSSIRGSFSVTVNNGFSSDSQTFMCQERVSMAGLYIGLLVFICVLCALILLVLFALLIVRLCKKTKDTYDVGMHEAEIGIDRENDYKAQQGGSEFVRGSSQHEDVTSPLRSENPEDYSYGNVTVGGQAQPQGQNPVVFTGDARAVYDPSGKARQSASGGRLED